MRVNPVIPKDGSLLAQLAARVEGILVVYEKVNGEFAYLFKVHESEDAYLAECAARELIGQMLRQSFNNGDNWVCKKLYHLGARGSITMFKASFRGQEVA